MSNSALRIALIAPGWYDIPPDGYGGIEHLVADLADGLVAHGHQVWLIGTGENRTRARFLPVTDRQDPAGLGQSIPTITYSAQAERLVRDMLVDVIHDHTEAGPLMAPYRSAPTVVTAHGPVTDAFGDYYQALDRIGLVAISQAQREINPDLNWVGTVYNAVRAEDFPFRDSKEEFVLFLGRASPDKGAHLAIDAARAAGRPIVLAGKCVEPDEQEYFEQAIRPRLGPDAEWVGEADTEAKNELLGRARCLLFPILWDEPFGIVMIEANACGTPVVALRRGSVPEVITDGVNGLIRDDPAELPEAIHAVEQLDPASCREHLRGRFDPESMVRGYERVYQDVLAS